jgi:hypothetical protein
VPRRNRSKGDRKRDAYLRRLAEYELQELEAELHQPKAEQADPCDLDAFEAHHGDD